MCQPEHKEKIFIRFCRVIFFGAAAILALVSIASFISIIFISYRSFTGTTGPLPITTHGTSQSYYLRYQLLYISRGIENPYVSSCPSLSIRWSTWEDVYRENITIAVTCFKWTVCTEHRRNKCLAYANEYGNYRIMRFTEVKWTIRADDKSMGIIRECYAHDACPTYPSNGTYIYPPASSWLIEDYGRYLEQSSTTPGIIFVVLSGAMMSVASIVILLGMFAIRPPKNGCYHFGEEAHGRNDYVAFINAVFFGRERESKACISSI